MFTLVVPIEVIYAKVSLGTTDAGFGVLLASWGAGIVVGSLIFIRVKGRSTVGLVLLSSLAIGLAYLGLATADSLVLACLISVVGGMGNGIQWIAVVTAVQERTPVDYQARVTGMLESLSAAMPGVGYLLGAAIVALGSPRTAYAVAGTGVVALVVVGLGLRSRLDAHDSPRYRFPEPVVGSSDPFAPTPSVEAGNSDR
jgi:MFS family permease